MNRSLSVAGVLVIALMLLAVPCSAYTDADGNVTITPGTGSLGFDDPTLTPVIFITPIEDLNRPVLESVPMPEPSTLVLLCTGLMVGLLIAGYRRSSCEPSQ